MAGEQLPAMPIAFPVAYWEAEVAAGEGVAALQYQGHFTPSAGPGSPQLKDVASDPAAGISPGRAGATRGPRSAVSPCTPELWDGSEWSKWSAQSPAHPGAGWASLTSSSGPPTNLCAAKQLDPPFGLSSPELSRRGALGLRSLAFQLWWDAGY